MTELGGGMVRIICDSCCEETLEFGTLDTVLAIAAAEGWTHDGDEDLCMDCA